MHGNDAFMGLEQDLETCTSLWLPGLNEEPSTLGDDDSFLLRAGLLIQTEHGGSYSQANPETRHQIHEEKWQLSLQKLKHRSSTDFMDKMSRSFGKERKKVHWTMDNALRHMV